MPIRIEIPKLAVVALVGASSSGKSTFAKKHFKPTEILSSDYFRALVCDDENNQQVTPQAFDALYHVAKHRLELGFLTLIDATNVQKEARASVLNLARGQNCQAAAIVLDIPEKILRERHEKRSDRDFGYSVVARQAAQLRQSLKHLEKEGFRYVHILKSEEEINDVEIVRNPLWCDKKDETGPFDIIGDIHGCYDELCDLLDKLGYGVDRENCMATAPNNRKTIFLGDLCDRGPKNIESLRLVMGMVRAGAYCVAGNHDAKLLKKLRGSEVQLTHGLDRTVEQLGAQSEDFAADATKFLDGLISHYVFDRGKLVVAHAGLKEKYQGRAGRRVRDFCLYGETTGETDEYGLPVRLPWANEYRGRAIVVYGHVPSPEVEAVNRTFAIDTGCVFGGKLTAFRYPEQEIVQIGAQREYCAPAKPFLAEPAKIDDIPNFEDVSGQKYFDTRLRRGIKISAENSAAALETMSRYAADPHWLIYLPPTMSPCETSKLPDYLEYPAEALDYYKAHGIGKVVCEQKHMGSRAVVVLCKDADIAARKFKAGDGSFGIIYTRTGRRFFDDGKTENAILSRLRTALDASGFWEDFETGWVCLDAEIMPWSAKAQKLLEEQYAPAGQAGRNGLQKAANAIREAIGALGGEMAEAGAEAHRSADLPALLERYEKRAEALDLYAKSYRRYCWELKSMEDYRIAPFHVLATEKKAWFGENHVKHMETIAKYMTGTDPIFMATDHMVVDLADENSVAAGIRWWEELTGSGGEGMVVKPYDFIATKGELLQPAVKCRGREYLRIIYGPEYMLENNLARLKNRSLAKKRNLAASEFALGVESLERFVCGEPFYRVHECVFAVLAMESEPVDPRL